MAFPVEEKIGDIRRALAANRDVVLTAPPGSGKTTCVPPALLDEPWLKGTKIVMLEPRRLAARNCASYIARRRGEAVGGTVGSSSLGPSVGASVEGETVASLVEDASLGFTVG